MQSTFDTAHNALLANLAKLKPGQISNYPMLDEVLDVRDYVESLAKAVDAHLAEIFSEARYMAGVCVPKSGVSALQDYLHDNSVLDAFTSAATDFPRVRAA